MRKTVWIVLMTLFTPLTGMALNYDVFAAQSILLGAVSRGLNGIVILNFNPDSVQQALDLPLKPLAVIGLGKGLERIFLLPVHQGDSLKYFRKEGVHYVPKLTVDDLII